jgi:hypothetical protein
MGNRPKQADTVLIDGGKVGDLRVGVNLTQDLLASEVVRLGWHLSRGYLPSLEAKPIARVHKKLAEALATALGVKVDDFKATPPQQTKRKVRSKRRMAVDSPAGVQQDAPLEPSASSETIPTRQRRSGILGSPLLAEPSEEDMLEEPTTVGHEIDEIIKGLSQDERGRLREVLVPLASQLTQLITLSGGGLNEEEIQKSSAL